MRATGASSTLLPPNLAKDAILKRSVTWSNTPSNALIIDAPTCCTPGPKGVICWLCPISLGPRFRNWAGTSIAMRDSNCTLLRQSRCHGHSFISCFKTENRSLLAEYVHRLPAPTNNQPSTDCYRLRNADSLSIAEPGSEASPSFDLQCQHCHAILATDAEAAALSRAFKSVRS